MNTAGQEAIEVQTEQDTWNSVNKLFCSGENDSRTLKSLSIKTKLNYISAIKQHISYFIFAGGTENNSEKQSDTFDHITQCSSVVCSVLMELWMLSLFFWALLFFYVG